MIILSRNDLIKRLHNAELALQHCRRQFGNVIINIDGEGYKDLDKIAKETKEIWVALVTQKRRAVAR